VAVPFQHPFADARNCLVLAFLYPKPHEGAAWDYTARV
jgi:hypothetical protein